MIVSLTFAFSQEPGVFSVHVDVELSPAGATEARFSVQDVVWRHVDEEARQGSS